MDEEINSRVAKAGNIYQISNSIIERDINKSEN